VERPGGQWSQSVMLARARPAARIAVRNDADAELDHVDVVRQDPLTVARRG
jgi:hypothetical protein